MEDDSADFSAINGLASPSDFDLLTGGSYTNAQSTADALDNGTLVNNSLGGVSPALAANANAAPAGGASYTPPSWLSSITGLGTSLAGAAGNINTAVQPIIGGKPAVSPAQAGQAASAVNGIVGSLTKSPLLLVGLVVAAFLIFRKKR